MTPTPSLPILLVAAILFLEVSPRPQTTHPGGTGHPVPSPSVTRQMRAFKTEMIKNRILSEVNLSEPPPLTPPVHLPQSVINLLVSEGMKESILGEGENLIAYPTNENTGCENFASCSRFEFEIPAEGKFVSSVHLWVRKWNTSEALFVSACSTPTSEDGDRQQPQPETLSEVKTEMGWAIFEIPFQFFPEGRSDPLYCAVEVIGSSSQDHETEKPFLVANTSPESAERKRRSATGSSSKNCTCCLVDFYVSFKEINWHWVVAPLGFSANMCYGKCNSQLNSYPSHYHRMISTILDNKTATSDKKEDLWTPCCSPTQLSPLNMIYLSGNNTSTNSSSSFIYHKIPDMITESCGCW